MKRTSIRLVLAMILTMGATQLGTNPGAFVIDNWWPDSDDIIMEVNFFPTTAWGSPAEFQMSEWNEVDVTTNDHPFLVSSTLDLSFGADDGLNTMGFLDEAGLNSEYNITYLPTTANPGGALAWTVCWDVAPARYRECDIMLDSTLPWSLTPDDDEWFQSTVLHELGHVRGLGHDNTILSMQNSGTSKLLRDEILYMDDKNGVRQNATTVSERDIVIYPKWHDGALPQWMTVSTTTPRSGDTVVFNNLTVENRGSQALGSVSLGVYFSTNSTISTNDTLVSTATFPSFGTSTTSTFDWLGVVPPMTDCGIRYFGAIIDHNNVYTERFEGNNDVVFVDGDRNPVPFDIRLERDSQEPNDSLSSPRTITLPFSNSNLTIDQDGEVDYYRFTLPGLTRVTFTASFTHANGDVNMALRDNSNAILETSTGSGNSESITEDLPAGTYKLQVYGSGTGSCNRYSLTGSGVALVPDIFSIPASHNFGDVTTGTSADRVFTVFNDGAATASLNITSTTVGGTNPSQFSIPFGSGAVTLPPGGNRNITVRFTPTTAGVKNAVLRIRSDDPDEDPYDIRLSGSGVVPPNLRITALSGPALGSPGQAVTLTNTVQNNGGSPSGGFGVGLYLSTDNVCTTGDTLLATRGVASLAAGASSTSNTPVTIPAGTPLASRFFCAIADSNALVVESNEADNTAFRALTIVPAVPTVDLRINGLDGASVDTTGTVQLTLDIGASTYASNLDWYWTLTAGGTTYWITLTGLTTIPAPLLTGVPGTTTLANATLLDMTLPPGTQLINAFYLINGATTIASDSITANVVTTAGATDRGRKH
jgi:hypothetical protein